MSMLVTRRTMLGGALAAAAAVAVPAVRAQDATPEVAPEATPGVGNVDGPGYGIARVRSHPSADAAQAVYPDVMTRFLPATAAVPGYVGYLFAFADADPADTINITLLADAAAAEAANDVARAYVEGMDPRLTPETPLAEQGEIRIFQPTDRPGSALPPLLHGCHITMRHRRNSPETDIEGVIRSARDGFGPIQGAMDGFVLYCWMHAEGAGSPSTSGRPRTSSGPATRRWRPGRRRTPSSPPRARRSSTAGSSVTRICSWASEIASPPGTRTAPHAPLHAVMTLSGDRATIGVRLAREGQRMRSSPRAEKLDLRLSTEAKRRLVAAAAAQHRSVSEFVLTSALAQANETLADRQRFGLDDTQWAAFVAALDAPSRDLPRVTRLLREPSVFAAEESE